MFSIPFAHFHLIVSKKSFPLFFRHCSSPLAVDVECGVVKDVEIDQVGEQM